MKQFKMVAPFVVGVTFTCLLLSCNNPEEKKIDEPLIDSTAKTMDPVAPAKPGNLVVAMHKVANFNKWLAVYESQDSLHNAYALRKYVIGRGVKDSNMVMIAMWMDDTAKAKQFMNSPSLKDVMKKAGVTSAPTVDFYEMQMLDTSANVAPTRLIVTHKVKDWDAWKTGFDSHKQARLDAGLTDRAVGYKLGDNKSVSIVFAVADMKKAEDFSKSPDLKEKMEKGGVEGPPTKFFYTVAKRY